MILRKNIDSTISFGVALVAGKKRVPNPAAGITALRILCIIFSPYNQIYSSFFIAELNKIYRF